MNLREAFAEALVDGWVSGVNMSVVMSRAWALSGLDKPESADETFAAERAAAGVKWIQYKEPAKSFVHTYMRGLSDFMWEARKRDLCIVYARKALGLKKTAGQGAMMKISVRERDKRNDWATVK